MRSDEYWIKRMEALLGMELNKAEDYLTQLRREYRKADAAIRHDIEVFYARFAKNNEIGLTEARQILKGKELEEFRWTVEDYISKGKENAYDESWMKELLNASIRVRVTRLEALLLQMRQHIEVLTKSKLDGTDELL
ncbi:phage head morphogenesis protein, partial [Paenibacillus shunpengii]